MKVSRLIVGIIALSFAAAAAQAAPTGSGANTVVSGVGPCLCTSDGLGGVNCVNDYSCGTGTPCGAGNTCPAGLVPWANNCCAGAEGVCNCTAPCDGETCTVPGAAPGSCGVWPICPPSNQGNDCANAVPVPGGLDPCNDKTPTGPFPAGSCMESGSFPSTTLNDMWLTFVATATEHRVRTDVASAGSDSEYLVYSGTCGSLTEIGCSADEGLQGNGNICVGGLTVGATYYVRLGAWASETCTYVAYGANYCPYLGSCGDYNVTIEAASGTTCGDGLISCVPDAEQCDPPGSCCSATCQNIFVCGDGVVCETEECDPPGPTCSSTCLSLEICGDNIINQAPGVEECDGTATPLCPAGSYCATNCHCVVGIPAVSEWGLAVLTLIGLVSGTILFGRRRAAAH